jgi:hypothetical protein
MVILSMSLLLDMMMTNSYSLEMPIIFQRIQKDQVKMHISLLKKVLELAMVLVAGTAMESIALYFQVH